MIHNYKACWPTLGPYRYLRRASKGPCCLKQALTGIKSCGGQTWCQIWSQLSQIGLTGSESWLTYTLVWYWASSWLPGGPKEPVLVLNAPFGGPGGPWRSRRGHIWSQLPRLLCLGWTHGYHRLWPGIEPLPGGNFDFWPNIGPVMVQKRDI